jgi:hypothetical protein
MCAQQGLCREGDLVQEPEPSVTCLRDSATESKSGRRRYGGGGASIAIPTIP